jgi:hypothetical protein
MANQKERRKRPETGEEQTVDWTGHCRSYLMRVCQETFQVAKMFMGHLRKGTVCQPRKKN